MNPRAPLDPRLLEALSAYLDGRLDAAERTALEERLKKEESLRRQLGELRTVRDSLRALPVLKSPRPLTLSRDQAGAPARRPFAFSPRSMAWGSALASLAFVAVFILNVFSGGAAMLGAAPKAAAPEATMMLQAAEAAEADTSLPAVERSVAGAAATPSAALRGTATVTPPATEPLLPPRTAPEPTIGATATPGAVEDGCANLLYANKAVDQCGEAAGLMPETERPSFALPDFKTAAPYLEVFFGLTAVLLAALAVLLRRTR